MGGLARRQARSVRLACSVALAVVAVGATASGVAADSGWNLSSDPDSVTEGASTVITMRAKNTGSNDRTDAIGCLEVRVPAEFSVSGVTITETPTGKTWTVSASGSPTVLRARAASDDDRLVGGGSGERVSVSLTVVGALVGAYSLQSDAFLDTTCTASLDQGRASEIAIVGPTPAPKATPKPTAAPTQALTPAPSPSAEPSSSAEPSPSATAPSPSPGPIDLWGAGSVDPPAPPAAQLDAFSVPSAEPGLADLAGVNLATAMLASLGLFLWVIPGAVLTVPGLVLILGILAQAGGGLAWVPVVRRKLGWSGGSQRIGINRGA